MNLFMQNLNSLMPCQVRESCKKLLLIKDRKLQYTIAAYLGKKSNVIY